MKKIIALILSICMIFSICGCGKNSTTVDVTDYKIAMITDFGDITDASFNQSIYEACRVFSSEHEIKFTYFKPSGNSTEARISMIDKAIEEGFNVIVLSGYIFGEAIVEVYKDYPEVKFIGIDVSKGDLLAAALKNEYSGNPDDYDLNETLGIDNVYCAVYREEISGFLAGYTAVRLGYSELGFLGGKDIEAINRYGYGFIQGCEFAAAEKDIQVNIKYGYADQFYGDNDVTNVMAKWYSSGTEVIFACGGSVFSSVCTAAAGVGGKVIGVDVDQKQIIDSEYGEGMTITSAMKGLYPATYDTLNDVIVNGKWDAYSGKVNTLGLISSTDPSLNYCQIPVDSTQFDDKYTLNDYKKIVKDIFDEVIKVSGNTKSQPFTSYAKVEYLGCIK